ncbi:MAG: GTP cyclohydrolase I FolE [Cyclobacteriaceae bacterium]|nr:GTP cyclohydrolase I FolE [Cyclobacteriaceae bacterium]MCB0500957.1 GTP cyclohydrolase I FolE [Cyclobacteriaceae bacterium]MCB9236535.1 GTP cyclohydrolase I FolE [Flammeovirgaceae bacterium]MCO5273033.1 GTP cyclohydrolase I FolE [Cyclobacteriaceae bacterium]MCW5903200.1 GTP cyclohydrolase I FolE [Cyclobacteriaceae bacterium]
MRQKEISLNIRPIDPLDEEFDDDHILSSWETPVRADAFVLDDDQKVDKIEKHFREIMNILGLDLNDDSLSGTPRRVAKMYVKEVFSGLNPKNRPTARLFDNKYNYDQMLVEKDITFYSHCEHHFVPIYGKAHVAYFSSGKVIGLSKINRIVQYYAKRPQVQERLTVQIGKELERALNTRDVGVVMDANHMCVASRGVGDTNSKTGTAYFSGKFKDENIKREFLNYINSK